MDAADAWLLAAVAAEIRRAYLGARIQRVVQPSAHDVYLHLYRAGDQGYLLLSAHPQLARVHPVADRPPAPPTPPAFCQLLRRHLEGSRLTGLAQPGMERLLELHLEGRDELGNPRRLRLVAELPGRAANLILVGPDGRILDALRRVEARGLVPGRPYVPPPRPGPRIDPVLALQEGGADRLAEDLVSALRARPPDEPPAERLLAVVFGLTRPLAEAAAAWAAGAPGAPPGAVGDTDPAGEAQALARAVVALAAAVAEGRAQPCLGRDARGRSVALPWPLPGVPCRPQPSAGEACARAYAELEALEREQALRQRIATALRAARQRVLRRLEKQEEELRTAAEAERLREQGELLLALQHLVPRGAARVALPALDDPSRTVEVDCDPRLSPVANAQRLLQRYRKERRAAGEVAARLEAGRQELRYLEEAALALEQAEGAAELQALEAELTAQGILAPRPNEGATTAKRRAGQAPHARLDGPPPLAFAAAGGWRILVGRSAAGNDTLTLRLARPDDIWLHARQMPGSHVLLRPPAEAPAPAGALVPPEQALLQAARCAAYYSAGRHGSRVPVDWTRRRNVWKPAGAKPGLVRYEGEQTLFVDPVDLPPRLA